MIQSWYSKQTIYWLVPFSVLFRLFVFLRRLTYQVGFFKIHAFSAPIIIVGNISVGGTGKTPCVIALVNYLRTQGFNPGIISRGYGGKLNRVPCDVQTTSSPKDVGDEAILLKQRCQCPVIIARKRVKAAAYLLKTTPCDLIISDDGLQHYALARTVEIVMSDANRGFGNRACLPAGPLREPISRLKHSDFMLITGDAQKNNRPDMPSQLPVHKMALVATDCYQLKNTSRQRPLSDFSQQTVHAAAGIAYPKRFFTMLINTGIDIIEHAYADHYVFQQADFNGFQDKSILLTEKDAVKCQQLDLPNAWVVPIKGVLNDDFFEALLEKLKIKANQ